METEKSSQLFKYIQLKASIEVEIDNFPAPSDSKWYYVGATVAKTVLATWLLLADWWLSKAKTIVRTPIGDKNFGLSVMIKAE